MGSARGLEGSSVVLAEILLVFVAACGRRSPAPAIAEETPADVASSPGRTREAHGGPSAAVPVGVSCGALGCAQFDSARAAFAVAVARDVKVVAIGEAHAQKGSTAPSAAQRFTVELLPLLAGRASDLLVELLMPPTGCADAAAEVRTRQAPATSKQAPTNQSEYVTLGEAARALGIVPDMLRPTCADMDAVNRAGDGAIDASLAMIARLTVGQATRLVERDERSDADRGKAVVIYGGMLHNDLEPPPERATWAYAPALDAKTRGELVAVDLVVPEFITDDATWRAFAWYSAYDRARLGAKATLFRTSDKSFVLVFPETRP